MKPSRYCLRIVKIGLMSESNTFPSGTATPDLRVALTQLFAIYPVARQEVLAACSAARNFIQNIPAERLVEQRLDLTGDLASKFKSVIAAYKKTAAITSSELCVAAILLQIKLGLAFDQAIHAIDSSAVLQANRTFIDYMSTPIALDLAGRNQPASPAPLIQHASDIQLTPLIQPEVLCQDLAMMQTPGLSELKQEDNKLMQLAKPGKVESNEPSTPMRDDSLLDKDEKPQVSTPQHPSESVVQPSDVTVTDGEFSDDFEDIMECLRI